MRHIDLATRVKFYFDEHSPRAVEKGLLKRGYEVVMAVDVGMTQKDADTGHLPYELNRVSLFSHVINLLPDAYRNVMIMPV